MRSFSNYTLTKLQCKGQHVQLYSCTIYVSVTCQHSVVIQLECYLVSNTVVWEIFVGKIFLWVVNLMKIFYMNYFTVKIFKISVAGSYEPRDVLYIERCGLFLRVKICYARWWTCPLFVHIGSVQLLLCLC